MARSRLGRNVFSRAILLTRFRHVAVMYKLHAPSLRTSLVGTNLRENCFASDRDVKIATEIDRLGIIKLNLFPTWHILAVR